jgi:hypothetical protein
LGEWIRVEDLPGVACMPVPRCATCKWWQQFAPDVQPGTVGGILEVLDAEGFGEALKSLTLPLLGDCTLFECHNGEQIHESSKVIVSRTGSGEATIITLHDFGCVQWEAK